MQKQLKVIIKVEKDAKTAKSNKEIFQLIVMTE